MSALSPESGAAEDEEVGWAIRRLDAIAERHDCRWKVERYGAPWDPRRGKYRVTVIRTKACYALGRSLAEAAEKVIEKVREEWT